MCGGCVSGSEGRKTRTVKVYFGINGAFLTRRWEEPENFMRLTRECGYLYHEFCADVLDPFFHGDKSYQVETARKVREAAKKYGVVITDYYTGVATHRFHGLSHSDPRVRERMKQWIIEAMDIVLEMGVDRIGGHWDAFSVEVLSDPERTKAAFENIYQQFRELAVIGKQKGIAAIYNEQMYIPSEIPWTMQQAEEFLIAVNRDSAGCPIRLTIDTGHQAGMHYGLSGPDLDYAEWIKRFGAIAEVIHIQQTTPDASCHWAFTEEYNNLGHVRIERVIEALKYSHQHYHEQPYAPYLPPAERTFLIAEIIPGSTKREDVLLRELKETADYLRRFIPDDGLEIVVNVNT